MLNSQPLVYCILLNWNSLETTRTCIARLENQSYRQFEIVIVDNDSQDGSGEVLKKEYSKYFFIQTGKNGGYAWGNNAGIRFSLKRNADFVWIVNPDVRVSKNTLAEMVRFMGENNQVGICGPRILWQRPKIEYQMIGMKYCEENAFWPEGHIINDFSPEKHTLPIDAVSVIGCSMLVRKEVFQGIGLIREDFFMYHEEVEFNLRAQDAGWRTVVLPYICDEHDKRQNEWVARKSFYLARNFVYLARIRRKSFRKTILKAFSSKTFLRTLKHKGYKAALNYLLSFVVGMFNPLGPAPKL